MLLTGHFTNYAVEAFRSGAESIFLHGLFEF
jgi:hypothetical protein